MRTCSCGRVRVFLDKSLTVGIYTIGRGTPDRPYWDQKSSPVVMALADETIKILNEHAKTEQKLNYNKQFVGLTDGYRSRNFVTYRPRKKHLRLGVVVNDRTGWQQRFADADLDAIAKTKRVWVNLTRMLNSGRCDGIHA